MALSLVDLLRQSVSRYPNRTALIQPGGTRLTYARLDQASEALAGRLSVARGDRVGILLPKSLEAAVGIWATLRAGAAYVPIDASVPPARAAYIARDCDMRALIHADDLLGSVDAIREGVPGIQCLAVRGDSDGLGWDAGASLEGRPGTPRPLVPSPAHVKDLAYILYTSGSTGAPKGVMVSHGAALSFIDWAMETFALQPDDVLSNHAPFHFDLSTFDLFGAAAAGAALVILDEETVRFPIRSADVLEREGLSVWYSVPGALRRMVSAGRLAERDLSRLRLILFAGEVYPVEELKTLQQALPASVRLCNLYGPTETNVCTFWDVPAAGTWRFDQPPIGIDCSSCQGLIVDDNLQQVPHGTPGELLMRGGTLMSGYWGDAERTDRGFVDDLLYPHLRDRFYRTGDIVSRDADGLYHFHGRRDHMVKIRGYRVELGEIESALHRLESVRDAAAVAVPRTTGAGDNELVVFVVPAREMNERDVTLALRADLSTTLPKYMLPTEFVVVPDLPLTSSGKVDRQTLADRARARLGLTDLTGPDRRRE